MTRNPWQAQRARLPAARIELSRLQFVIRSLSLSRRQELFFWGGLGRFRQNRINWSGGLGHVDPFEQLRGRHNFDWEGAGARWSPRQIAFQDSLMTHR